MSQQSNKKVSVIIPVYNSSNYISKCLESILNQTYTNYEIIAINDGSTDNSKEIISQYEKKYPNIIKHIEQENIGVAKTRNKGINIATGNYIMFIDNDDYIDNDYIQTFVYEMEKGNYDVVLGGYKRTNENGAIIKKVRLKNTEWSKLMVVAPWSKIYRKDYLINNKIEFLDSNIGEDVYFNLQALLLSNNIKIIDYIGYNWFFNSKSVSNTSQKSFKQLDVFFLLNKSYEIVKEKDILLKNNLIIEMYFFRYIIWLLLFTMKKASKKEINEGYDKLFNWLKERFPNYRKNKLIGIGRPKGELIGTQLIYTIFMLFHKLRLGKFLIYFYTIM